MKSPYLTLREIRARGYAAMLRELGPVGYVRFIEEFQAGRGDYTRTRQEWVGRLTAEQIKAKLKARRRKDAKPFSRRPEGRR